MSNIIKTNDTIEVASMINFLNIVLLNYLTILVSGRKFLLYLKYALLKALTSQG